MSLKTYNRKRKFSQTPEPQGRAGKKARKGPLRFVVQLHQASRLHYDFRLEFGGVYKSWAVPKGPSLNPLDQRLAVFVEDHPLEYGSFEGIIPKGNYGAGTVMVWDSGTYTERGSAERKDSEAAMKKGLDRGHMTFVLEGQKLRGEFALIKLKKGDDKAWLLVKKRDAYAIYKDITRQNLSVKSGRSLEKIASQAENDGDVWQSKRKRSAPPSHEAPIPRRIKPMIATIGHGMPKEGEWIFEAPLDGLRALAEWDGRTANLHSRSLLPFEKKFPEIVRALKTFKSRMVLDGEIVTEKNRPIYWVYDILYFDGKDLRHSPLSKRKSLLKKAFPNSDVIRHHEYSIQMPSGKANEFIAKNSDSAYHSGVSKDWIRISRSSKTSSGRDPTSELRLSNLNKIFWPEEGFTKGDLIDYYKSISSYILPHLKDRPQSLNRYPNGIASKGFYQKDMTGYIPKWLKTQRIYSESRDKSIDYVVCQDERSLLYLVNLGCIEINPWLSRIDDLDNPDYFVIDLDPDGNDFRQVIKVAHDVHAILEGVGAPNFCKTSGATGIHICVPSEARYDYETVRKFSEAVCRIIAKKNPASTSIERNPARRRRKIYLDYMQNRRGQTLAAPYSVRPRAGAPVSMPLHWKELTSDIRPEQFTLTNAARRVKRLGDLWKPVLETGLDLEKCFRLLRRKYNV